MSKPMPSWTGEINTEKSDVNYSKGGWSQMPPRGLRLSPCRSGAAVDDYRDPRISGAAKKEAQHLRRCEPHFAIEPRWRPMDGRQALSTPSAAEGSQPPKTVFFAVCLQRLIGRLCASQVLVSVGPHRRPLKPARGVHATRIEQPRLRRLSCFTHCRLWKKASSCLAGCRRALTTTSPKICA